MKHNPLLLAVDRNHRNLELLAEFLGKEGYQVLTNSSIEEFEQALMRSPEINLALVDIAGFDRRLGALRSPTHRKHSFFCHIA